jgi:hypothetical protein
MIQCFENQDLPFLEFFSVSSVTLWFKSFVLDLRLLSPRHPDPEAKPAHCQQ